jgi:hypothetical protein
MARRPSKRMKDAAARRKQIESPPRRRAADARAASQRHAEQSAAGTDRRVVTCGWCGATVPVPGRGRVPIWCSASCRHRAWEQRRAAASGLSAIEVVDRPVEGRAHRHEDQASGRRRTSDRDTTDRRRVGPPARGAGSPARPRHDLRPSTVGDAPGRRRRRRLLRPTMGLTPATSLRQHKRPTCGMSG